MSKRIAPSTYQVVRAIQVTPRKEPRPSERPGRREGSRPTDLRTTLAGETSSTRESTQGRCDNHRRPPSGSSIPTSICEPPIARSARLARKGGNVEGPSARSRLHGPISIRRVWPLREPRPTASEGFAPAALPRRTEYRAPRRPTNSTRNRRHRSEPPIAKNLALTRRPHES